MHEAGYVDYLEYLVPLPELDITILSILHLGSPLGFCTLIFDLMRNLYISNACIYIHSIPSCSLDFLLQTFNEVWVSGKFTTNWKQATIIAIPKPGKDNTEPSNYRPIHWVDTWWANGDVSPSQKAVVDRLDLKISDYIQ